MSPGDRRLGIDGKWENIKFENLASASRPDEFTHPCRHFGGCDNREPAAESGNFCGIIPQV